MLLTAAVLVTVLAFALVVKPLAEGLLTPWQCLQLIGLSMLPALQYALPFAACFGATLSYYRLSSDNELVAAHAGGISHRAMIVPAAASGAVLLVVILVLSNFVIPRFLHLSERIDQHRVVQPDPMALRPAAPRCVLLQHAQARRRLPRVVDRGACPLDRPHEARGHRCNPRQSRNQIQQAPLQQQNLTHRSIKLRDDSARFNDLSVVNPRTASDVGSKDLNQPGHARQPRERHPLAC